MSTDQITPDQILSERTPEPSTPGPAAASARQPARSRIRPRLVGRAPAPVPGTVLHSVSGATAVMLALVAIGALIHEPVLIPPLAASAALIHSVPGMPLAQPRSVIAGHLLCAAVGYGGLAAFGSASWAAALAAGASLAVMAVARTPHSPACATAVVIVLREPDPRTFVPLLAGAVLLLVVAGCALSRVRAGAVRYPVYWW
ncbi:HPP family protein [Streptomyces sp. cmx-4-9]|uniref:HPP family protein n=1 Tax=Streptomyces sp. cmx-4-9 TaxID=2790941 RepID=UPI003980E408